MNNLEFQIKRANGKQDFFYWKNTRKRNISKDLGNCATFFGYLYTNSVVFLVTSGSITIAYKK